MRLLEEYIKKYGNALNEDVLKVDAFLNHQIDAQLMMELAKDFKEHFKDKHITKIATIETCGIAPAVMLGYLLQVPVVYFKKDTSRIMKDDLYTCQIHSFTKNKDYDIICSKKYLSADDHVLFLDDFMANGEACLGGIEILKQANAVIEGIGIVIEKAFQQGRLKVEAQGYPVYSQARIASLSQGMITFVSEEYEVA
ncbi:xanthine phosphoribosyltransferase [[Clostridium] innocuum]|nr:xanthine phosphoribosyltransferase [[Clostridium] innocuum]